MASAVALGRGPRSPCAARAPPTVARRPPSLGDSFGSYASASCLRSPTRSRSTTPGSRISASSLLMGSNVGVSSAASPLSMAGRRISKSSCTSPASPLGGGRRGLGAGLTTGGAPGRVPEAALASEALRMVLGHLAPVRDSLRRRTPRGLDRALRIACGTRYLRLATRLRHCKSEPTEKTVALEVAMASHLVRARTLLERWGKALVDIERAHHYRNADQLVSLLKQWRFESTEPQVAAAQADLERWAWKAGELAPRLAAAKLRKDIPVVEALLKEVSDTGTAELDGLKSARLLITRFREGEAALQKAIESRHSRRLAQAVKEWEFEDTHPDYLTAFSMVRRHEADAAELLRLSKHLHTRSATRLRAQAEELRAAVLAWQFAEDPELVQARGVLFNLDRVATAMEAEEAAMERAAEEAAKAEAARLAAQEAERAVAEEAAKAEEVRLAAQEAARAAAEAERAAAEAERAAAEAERAAAEEAAKTDEAAKAEKAAQEQARLVETEQAAEPVAAGQAAEEATGSEDAAEVKEKAAPEIAEETADTAKAAEIEEAQEEDDEWAEQEEDDEWAEQEEDDESAESTSSEGARLEAEREEAAADEEARLEAERAAAAVAEEAQRADAEAAAAEEACLAAVAQLAAAEAALASATAAAELAAAEPAVEEVWDGSSGYRSSETPASLGAETPSETSALGLATLAEEQLLGSLAAVSLAGMGSAAPSTRAGSVVGGGLRRSASCSAVGSGRASTASSRPGSSISAAPSVAESVAVIEDFMRGVCDFRIADAGSLLLAAGPSESEHAAVASYINHLLRNAKV